MKFLLHILYLIPLLISVSTTAQETDGERLFIKHCSECHGKDGNSQNKNIPKIADFSPILIFDIMDQFKTGDRKALEVKTKEGNMTSMQEISKALSTEEIEDISFFVSEQKPIFTAQDFDKEQANQGKLIHMDLCENCHVDGGTNPVEDTPLLRGQWKPYLIKQFDAFTDRSRYAPKRMQKRFRKLTEEDKKALIEFYISPLSKH